VGIPNKQDVNSSFFFFENSNCFAEFYSCLLIFHRTVAMSGRGVFVTVGTTKFEDLIREVDKKEFIEVLLSQGYTSMKVQIGKGDYTPKHASCVDSFDCEFYTLKSTLLADVENASLVISHGGEFCRVILWANLLVQFHPCVCALGAGTIMEVMRAKVPLVVVINETLMDNHQVELAHALETRGHLVSTTPKDLLETIKNIKLDSLNQYQDPDTSLFPELVDEEVGF
jgi:beta-1,4-N-acetylglucosaminyltransferase